MRELFILPKDVLLSLGLEETTATVEALKEANLYQLPYPEVDVRLAGDCVLFIKYDPNSKIDLASVQTEFCFKVDDRIHFNIGDKFWAEFKNISLEHTNYTKTLVIDKGHPKIGPFHETITTVSPTANERDAVANTLIILLATRNAVKNRKHNKMAKLGIGKGIKRYDYVTTISLPEDMEDSEEHKPSGVKKSPHLRRGHIRRQHHGPENAYVKTIWIAPVFVNADPNWVQKRKAYNVSIPVQMKGLTI